MKRFFVSVAVLILAGIIATGCSQTTAKMGDTVKVHYTLFSADGTELESTKGGNPYRMVLGQGGAISGFENGVVGMVVGETKTVIIPPEDAYGQFRADLIRMSHKSEFPPDVILEVGTELSNRTADGKMMPIKIIGIEGDSVKVDGNHPMAGKTLTFDLELVEILAK